MTAVRALALAALLVVAVVLQVAVFSAVSFEGVVPNVALLVVVAAGLVRGPEFAACLGFLAGSNCPHYDSEPLRRPTFRKVIASGALPEGVAADDGVALHYIDGRLVRVVSNRPRAKGWRVTRAGRRAVERQLATRYLGNKG